MSQVDLHADHPYAQGPATSALTILRDVFGHDQFRLQQAQAIEHILGAGDALVLMPTGGGKSLCYQVPALLLDGTTVVVSPLIALMQDQVLALRRLGVRAASLNSTMTPDDVGDVHEQLVNGELDLLYVAPERLMMPWFLQQLRKVRVALFAIDEAHCVSQWGHDFRPEYLGLGELAAALAQGAAPGVDRHGHPRDAPGHT